MTATKIQVFKQMKTGKLSRRTRDAMKRHHQASFESSGHCLESDDLSGQQNVSIRIDYERGELIVMFEMSSLYHTQKVRELQWARLLSGFC